MATKGEKTSRLTLAQRRYILTHFTELFALSVICPLIAIFSFPRMFMHDSREDVVTVQAHISDINVIRGKTDAKNIFEIQVAEYPNIFVAAKMKVVDQQILFTGERKGSPIRILVQEKDLKTKTKVPILGLSSPKNVYLQDDQTSSFMRANRGIAIFVFAASLLVCWFLIKRNKKRFKKEKEELEKLAELSFVDPFFLVIARYFKKHHERIILIGDALEFETKLAEKRAANKQITSAPKHVRAVSLLLQSGTDVNIKNQNGQTALHLSVLLKSAEAVDLLLRNGADMNAVDKLKETPLMIAAKLGYTGIVLKLLEKGADITLQNHEAKTALQLAEGAEKKNQAIIQMLKTAVTKFEAAKKAEAEKQALLAAQEAERNAKLGIAPPPQPTPTAPPAQKPVDPVVEQKVEEKPAAAGSDPKKKAS
ncbi:MAG: ankyrin repeat domain-containing protein [Bacteriovoracia bacterium]